LTEPMGCVVFFFFFFCPTVGILVPSMGVRGRHDRPAFIAMSVGLPEGTKSAPKRAFSPPPRTGVPVFRF
jgi:hypothetical protein